MKLVLVIGTLILTTLTHAADSAKCSVSLNGSLMSEKEVLHMDYDVKLNHEYAYSSKKNGELRSISVSYKTNSVGQKSKLVVRLEDKANSQTTLSKSQSADFTKSVLFLDADENLIRVDCKIL